MTKKSKNLKCSICKKEIRGPKHPFTEQLLFDEGEYMGNNPAPFDSTRNKRVCDMCDSVYVLPARMGYDVFSEDWEKRTESFRFGMRMWKSRLKARKLMYEMGFDKPSPIYIDKDDPTQQLDPTGKPI